MHKASSTDQERLRLVDSLQQRMQTLLSTDQEMQSLQQRLQAVPSTDHAALLPVQPLLQREHSGPIMDQKRLLADRLSLTTDRQGFR